jgi:hypothetical protein
MIKILARAACGAALALTAVYVWIIWVFIRRGGLGG